MSFDALFSLTNIPLLVGLSVFYASTATLSLALIVVWCRLNDGLKVRPLVVVLVSGILLATLYGVLILVNSSSSSSNTTENEEPLLETVLLRYTVYTALAVGRTYQAVRMVGFGQSFYAWMVPMTVLFAHCFGLLGMYWLASSTRRSMALVGYYVFGTGVMLLIPPLLCFLRFTLLTSRKGPKVCLATFIGYSLFYWTLWALAAARLLNETILAMIFSFADSSIHLIFVVIYGRLLWQMVDKRRTELEDDTTIWTPPTPIERADSQEKLLHVRNRTVDKQHLNGDTTSNDL